MLKEIRSNEQKENKLVDRSTQEQENLRGSIINFSINAVMNTASMVNELKNDSDYVNHEEIRERINPRFELIVNRASIIWDMVSLNSEIEDSHLRTIESLIVSIGVEASNELFEIGKAFSNKTTEEHLRKYASYLNFEVVILVNMLQDAMDECED